MPLAPLPPNSTNRLFVKYTTGRKTHTLVSRYSDGITALTAADNVLQFLTDVQPVLPPTWAVTEVSYQDAGSIVGFPLAGSNLDGFTGGGGSALPLQSEPLQWNWMGRGGVTGRQVRVGLFGINDTPPQVYRFAGGGRPAWAIAATNSIIATSGISFLTIGGDFADWKDYINVQYNSYWETEARP